MALDNSTIATIAMSGVSLIATGIFTFIFWGVKTTLASVFKKFDDIIEIQTKTLVVLSAQEVKNDNFEKTDVDLKNDFRDTKELITEMKETLNSLKTEHCIFHKNSELKN